MANTDPRKFALDILKFSKAVGVSHDQTIRKLALDFLAGVLGRSPVRTGRFRGSWRVAAGSPDMSVDPPGSKAGGESPSGGQLSTIAALTIADVVRITNNLDYAEKLEGGSSTQAPAGVFSVTFDELVGNVNVIMTSIGAANGVR